MAFLPFTAVIPTAWRELTLSGDVEIDSTYKGVCVGLYVGGTAGDVVVVDKDNAAAGTTETIPVAANSVIDGRFVEVKSIGNGTTASPVFALMVKRSTTE